MNGGGRRLAYSGSACLLALLSACALTGKGDALYPRYFSPETEVTKTTPSAPTPSAPSTPPLALRMGQVEAASHVEERFAYRVELSELSYYDDRRWTEPPERYLRRALERELFQRRGIRRTVSGPGATLDLELTAFEELRTPPARVRLALSFSLHDDRQSQLERHVVVERPLPDGGQGASARDVTAALSSALDAAVQDVSEQVARELRAPVPVPEPCVGGE